MASRSLIGRLVETVLHYGFLHSISIFNWKVGKNCTSLWCLTRHLDLPLEITNNVHFIIYFYMAACYLLGVLFWNPWMVFNMLS